MRNYLVETEEGEIISFHKYSSAAKLNKARKAWRGKLFVVRIRDGKEVG